METAPLIEKIKSMRKAIKENFIALLEEHNAKYIDCVPIGNNPIVSEYSIDSDTFTLDAIALHKYSNGTYIKFESSNSYTNKDFYFEDIGIEKLIDIYDWVKENEEDLFEEE